MSGEDELRIELFNELLNAPLAEDEHDVMEEPSGAGRVEKAILQVPKAHEVTAQERIVVIEDGEVRLNNSDLIVVAESFFVR